MYRNLIFVTLLLLLLVFWGCETTPTGTGFSSDAEAMKAMITDNPDGYFTYGDHYGEQDTKTKEDSKAERYTTWWRQPTNVDIIVSVDVVNDSAFVTFSPEVSGLFHIFEYDTIPPDTIVHYMKNMKDYIIRYAIFKHYSDSLGYRGWRLDKISGVDITSYPNTVDIDSVRIECESYPDTVIANPLIFFSRGNILSFVPGEEVSLAIYSDDNIYAFFHARGHRNGHTRWWRWRFEEGGNGVWSGIWITPQMPRVRMFAFDILYKNTLDDHEYQYDSHVWIFPYRIR